MPYLGGGNLVDVYRVHADHTGIIAPDGTGSLIASPTSANRAFRFGGPTSGTEKFIIDSQFAITNGTAELTITSVDYSQSFLDFQKVAAPYVTGATSTDTPELYSEDGTYKIGGTSGGGSSPTYLIIRYSAVNGTKRIVEAGIGTFSVASLPSYKRNEWNQLQVKFTTTGAKTAMTIPNALLQTASPALVVAPGSPLAFALNQYLLQSELTAGA